MANIYLLRSKDSNLIFGVLIWHPDDRSHSIEYFWQLNEVFIHLFPWPFNRIKNKLTAMLHTYLVTGSKINPLSCRTNYSALTIVHTNQVSINIKLTRQTTLNYRQTTTCRIHPTITPLPRTNAIKPVFQQPNWSNPAVYPQESKEAHIHDSLPEKCLLLRIESLNLLQLLELCLEAKTKTQMTNLNH
jgi:hypothetical protein